MNIVTRAWNALVRFVRPDVDAIINTFLKAQSKLDAFIKREEATLEREWFTVKALLERGQLRNESINRAYRIIHNMDQLTA